MEKKLIYGKKKTNFGPDLACFSPNLVPKKDFMGLTSTSCYTLLYVNSMQFQGKLMSQT